MFEQGALLHKVTCSIHIRMVVEGTIVEEEADLAKEEADEVYLMRVVPTSDKKVKKIVEHLEEGGAIMPNQADKTTPWNVATMAS